MTALSWADLTYVLPATSLGYVLLALVAKFALHERVSSHALGRDRIDRWRGGFRRGRSIANIAGALRTPEHLVEVGPAEISGEVEV